MQQWSTLKKLIWLRATLLKAAAWVIEKITGSLPLVLTNAVEHAIEKLTRYGLCTQPSGIWNTAITQEGKCEQRNLPKGFIELDYIESDGDQYIDFNTTLDQDDVIEIEFEITASQNSTNIFGYRAGASSNNIMLFLGSTSNRVFIDFNNSDYAPYRLSYDCTVGTKYKAVISKSRRAFLSADGTVLAENTTACPDTITCPSAYLFAAAGTPAYNYGSACKVYSCVINGKRDIVGAKDSANVVEMYDKVSAAPFTNAGTGSFTAGPNATPTPYRSMGIWTNNGVLRYGQYGKNLYDVAGDTNGYAIGASGAITENTYSCYSELIPVSEGQYTYSGICANKGANNKRVHGYANGVWVQQLGFIAVDPNLSFTLTFTVPSGIDAIRISHWSEDTQTMVEAGSEATDYEPYHFGIYTDGTPEVLTVSADGAETQTVNDIPMLLGVGDTKDEVELVGGLLTHKIGIKVLDGTETGWTQATTTGGVLRFYLPFDGAATPTGAREQVASTHFVYAAEGQDLGITFLSVQTRVYFIPTDQTMTDTTWKAWLASEYANGTPVIVVYPLATETTEQTTAYPQLCNKLYDTADVSANVSDISVTFTTGEQTVPNPYSQLPIMCNNGKLKLSSNLFNKAQPNKVVAYIGNNGVGAMTRLVAGSTETVYSLPCKPNTTYTVSKTYSDRLRIACFPSSPAVTSSLVANSTLLYTDATAEERTSATVTTNAYANYLAIQVTNQAFSENGNPTEQVLLDSIQVEEGTQVTPYHPYGSIYPDGTPEVLTVSADGAETQTVNDIPMLLGVGDYKDEGEIIHGIKTAKVGVKVFDGTEEFSGTTQNRYFTEISGMAIGSTAERLCTHFKQNKVSFASLADGEFFCGASTTRINFRYSAAADVTEFKAYLAAQYAAGTPVIVVYPLATETTEQGTAQPINTSEGTNTIDSTSNVSPIDVEIEYAAKKGA